MKTLKIIIGFLLLISTGNEYVNASRELGNPFEIVIIFMVILFIVLSSWLIGTGFSKRKLKFKSFQFLKFAIISIVIFLFSVYINLMKEIIPTDFKIVNGIKIPMSKCVKGSVNIIPDKEKRIEFCNCLAEKITKSEELKIKYKSELENGRLGEIFKEIQNDEKYIELDILNCLNTNSMVWTNNLVKTMKNQIKKNFIGTEYEKTNNIDMFSDCLITEYRKIPLKEVLEDGFYDSTKGLIIFEKCEEKTKK